MRKIQVPSIFTVAPSGIEKLDILGEIPSFSVHTLIFVGMAAELELNVKLVSFPSPAFLKNVNGFKRPRNKTRIPYTANIHKMAIICVPAIDRTYNNELLPVSTMISTIEQKIATGIKRLIIVVIVRKRELHASNRFCSTAE